MADLTRFDEEEAKLEQRQRDTAEALKQVRLKKAKAIRDRNAKRDKAIGNLAREAGIDEWDNETLLAAFESVRNLGPHSYEKVNKESE